MAFRLTPFSSNPDISVWLGKELVRYTVYRDSQKLITLYNAAPVNPEEGMIVRADGTNWNPGSGRGFYGYDNGAWVFLG